MRAVFSASLLLLLSLPLRAEPEKPLTLSEAFSRALSSNLAIAGSKRELAATDAQRRAVFAALLPKVAAFANLGLNSTEVKFGEPPNERSVLPREDWDYKIMATQPIFAGLREKRAYDQSKLAVASARESERGTEEDVLLNVASAFSSAAAATALVEVETRNVALVANRLKQARDLFEAGETTRVDVLRAEADKKAAEERLVTARQLREDALGNLRVALALDTEFAVDGASASMPPLPSEDDLLAAALTRPAVRQAEFAVEAADLEVKKQQGAHLPVVFAEAGYVKQKRAFPIDEYGYGALRFSLDIFRGGEITARVVAAKEKLAQARLALEDLKRKVKEDVYVSLLAVEAARVRQKLAEERLTAAQADYEQTFDQYRNQLLTTLDLQSAETSLADARRGIIAAKLSVFLSEVRAIHAAGSLVSTVRKESAR